MPRYVRRSSYVDAVSWEGDNADEVIALVGADRFEAQDGHAMILSGIKGVHGWIPVPLRYVVTLNPERPEECWRVDPETFTTLYTLVEE